MGILFCIFRYFSFGGLQRDFLRIACVCKNRGYKVVVYTFSWEGDIPEGLDIRLVPDKRYTNHGKAAFFSKWITKELRRNSYQAVVGFNRIKGLDVYFAGDNCLQEKTLYDKSFFYKLTPRFLTYSSFEKAVFNPSAKVEILALTERQKSDIKNIILLRKNDFTCCRLEFPLIINIICKQIMCAKRWEKTWE